MKLPDGSYLVKPLNFLPGKAIEGIVVDKGEKYTMDGEEWKKDVDDINKPKIDDRIMYSLSDYGSVDDIIIKGVLYHLIKNYKLIL